MAYLGEDTQKLGFGLMRLPKLEDGAIDIPQVSQMVDEFLAAGCTYFDTAWAYSGSEEAVRQALVERHPRGRGDERLSIPTSCQCAIDVKEQVVSVKEVHDGPGRGALIRYAYMKRPIGAKGTKIKILFDQHNLISC